jgi:hypothetical protein
MNFCIVEGAGTGSCMALYLLWSILFLITGIVKKQVVETLDSTFSFTVGVVMMSFCYFLSYLFFESIKISFITAIVCLGLFGYLGGMYLGDVDPLEDLMDVFSKDKR